jgi:hypothetical protein
MVAIGTKFTILAKAVYIAMKESIHIKKLNEIKKSTK